MAGALLQQTALITGAATGLGLAIATRRAAEGVRLALMDINAGRLQEVREEPGCSVYAADLRLVFDVNIMGSYDTSKYVLPLMMRQGYGRVLHIVSIAGKDGNAGISVLR